MKLFLSICFYYINLIYGQFLCKNSQVSEEFEVRKFFVEVDIDPVSGKVGTERWYDETGALNRPGDLPAYTRYCPETGLPDYQRWHNGKGEHRENDKPSTIATDTETGTEVALGYSILGEPHRDGDKPANILKTSAGKVEQEDFWKYGKLHRDPQLGPARIFYNPEDGTVIRAEYWINDTQVAPPANTPKLDI